MGTATVVTLVVLIVVWAIFASNKMSRAAQTAQINAAKKPSGEVGKAKWGLTSNLKGQGGIRLGFDEAGGILRFTKPRCHGLVVGKTGVGKGVWAISAILDMVGRASIVLVDMKGNTTAVCKRHMATSGTVTVCNPFEKDKGIFPMELPKSTPYNPMGPLVPGKPGFIVGCKRLAILMGGDADLVKSDNSAHFKEKTESLIAGVIAFVCESYSTPSGSQRRTICGCGETGWKSVLTSSVQNAMGGHRRLRFAATDAACGVNVPTSKRQRIGTRIRWSFRFSRHPHRPPAPLRKP